MSFQVVKTQVVELPVATGSTLTKFSFPTQNFLRAKNIVSLETYNATDVAISPQGNNVINNADMIHCYLTLYGQNPQPTDSEGIKSTGQGDWMERMPLTSLHRVAGSNPYVRDLYAMMPRVIVWEKSYIEIFGVSISATPISFLFLVGYTGNAGDEAG